jgi:hypothetical protein
MGQNELTEGLKCTEENCTGDVDLENVTRVQTSCHSFSAAYACNSCGRLHFLSGDKKISVVGISNRQSKKAYLTKNGGIDLRD